MLGAHAREPSSSSNRVRRDEEAKFLARSFSYDELCERLKLDAAACPHLGEHRFPCRVLRPGQALYSTQSRFDHIYAVHSGNLKIVLHAHGKALITGFVFAGEVLGLDGLFNGAYSHDVSSLTDAVVIAIPAPNFFDLCKYSPTFGSEMLARMSWRLQKTRQHSRALAHADPTSRVAGFLLWVFSHTGRSDGGRRSLALNMSRDEIGSYLRLARPTVSRVFTLLRAKGYLDVACRRVEILDYSSLRLLAGLGRASSPSI